MNREEMEKKKVFRFSWGPAMDYCKRKGVTPDSLVYEHFRAGWDACAEEYEDLEEKLNKAIEALEFYASGWTMGFHAGELLVSTGIELNFEEVHQRARKTLKEIRGE